MRHFLAFKSYGDLVIACHHLRGNASDEDVLVCAEHLRPLVSAIQYAGKVVWLNCGERGVPALFDIRKHGWFAAFRSAYRLRHAIEPVVRTEDILVFDRMGWRQRYLAAGHFFEEIVSGKQNIYLDYEAFLGVEGRSIYATPSLALAGKIGIFPDSRVAKKEIPGALVQQIADALHAAGHDVRVVRTGPGRDVETFEALAACIGSLSAIVSADSLPAHLAEYFGRPSYVFSPVPNLYWLPKTAFEMNSHSIFGEPLKGLCLWAEGIV